MSDALERLLLTWDGGVEDGDGDEDGEPEPGGDLARRVEALETGLEDLARELRSGLDAIRVAVAEGRRARETRQAGSWETGGEPGRSPGTREPQVAAAAHGAAGGRVGRQAGPPGRGGWIPELVTRETAEDDAEVYGDAWPLVKEWRELKDRLPVRGRSLSWLTGYERLLTLELSMLEEHGLTLPPQKQPVRDSLSRRNHTRWRWKALDRTQVSIRKRKLLRWLRRLLTLGAWWK